jgi:hypothetical protein
LGDGGSSVGYAWEFDSAYFDYDDDWFVWWWRDGYDDDGFKE